MFAVVHIPNCALQSVLRHEPELQLQAVALVDPELPKPTIVEVTMTAREHGVVEGLTASQAMARCDGLIIKTRSRASERAATEVLLQTAYAFSPAIEDTTPGVCTMDLKGLSVAARDRGSTDGAHRAPLQSWAQKILRALDQFHLEAQIGFGPTPELALLAARSSGTDRSRRREEADAAGLRENPPPCVGGYERVWDSAACDNLPIAALEPAPEIADILRRWGIRTVGEFIALGKNDVAERLGAAALGLFERVSIDSIRPLKLVSPPETFTEQIEFENEIETAEPLLFVLRRFTEQLSRRLEMIYLVVAELHLELSLASGSKYERTFKIPSPTGQIETLFRTLQTHLDTLRTDSPIISLRLAAKPCKPETHQFGLFETTLRDPNRFAETLARLTALCGSERVGTPQVLPTNKPDSFRMASPEFDSSGTGVPPVRFENSGRNGRKDRKGNDGSESHGQDARATIQLRRFRPARPAYIEFRDGQPAILRSEVFNGAVADSRGPFRSSGNWWDSGIWAREEWDVETRDGLLLRVFRSSDGCFVEGVYD